MEHEDIRLTSTEISALWTLYNESTATNCFYKHFLKHLKDKEIIPIIEKAVSLNDSMISDIERILREEKFPIPKGFSDEDVNFSAPALFTDLYALSFVYREERVVHVLYASMLGKVVRKDIFAFIEECLSTSVALYKKSLHLMVSKGIYDRSPKIAYPEHVEFVQDRPSFLNTLFGEGRPLNTLEIGEIFCTIERNCIGLILLMGFIQVTTDNKVKEYFKKGKKLSEKQIDTFNKILKDSEQVPIFPITLEVTDSTISPFSERLMMFFITSTNQVGFTTLSTSLSVSMRKDLGLHYSHFIGEILKFGNEGLNIMIEKEWMEQPPLSTNRKG
ncbi:DUF3231 family protein [Virgibacillus sp. FSP13]